MMRGLAGFYERRVFPWLNDRSSPPELAAVRREALAWARGRVVEIGFGSGASLPHYPAGVESVIGVEPNDGMVARASGRIRACPFPVRTILEGAERIDAPDGSVDTAVSVLTLCSVAEPGRVLRELHRVLRDDGRLIVVEHGLAEDPGVARWQDRLNRIQNVVACGCNLNRPVVDLVERAGFRFETLRRFYIEGVPRTHGCTSVGRAEKMGDRS